MEMVAGEMASGKPVEDILRDLEDNLSDKIANNAVGKKGSRYKTISLLKNIWINIDDKKSGIHKDSLTGIKRSSSKNHLAYHWAMSCATYPFFIKVSRALGSLLQLQEKAKLSQINRKMVEELGDRQTVTYSTQKILRSLVDWGVLNDTQDPGTVILKKGLPKSCNIVQQSILLESILLENHTKTRSYEDLIQDPALFPFQIDANLVQVQKKNPRITTKQQSLDSSMVGL